MKTCDKVCSLIEICAKTAVGCLPGPLSAAFNAVFDNIKNGVLNQRAEKWKTDVITRLERLENDYENLIHSEAFATALIKTSELAVKTQSDEKRQFLANALINSFSNSIDEDKACVFLTLIERYTVFHIKIIQYLHDEYMNERFYNGVPKFYMLFKKKFPKTDDAYLKKILIDLKNDYLIESYQDDANLQFGSHRFEILTKLGNEFYEYLKSED